jgi:putative DNA primase/helicase
MNMQTNMPPLGEQSAMPAAIRYAYGENLSGVTTRTETWEEIADRLTRPHMALEDKTKSPNFIGGPTDNKGKARDNILARSMLTIDYDALPDGTTIDDIEFAIHMAGYAAVAYTTFSHGQDNSVRVRVVVPLDAEIALDDYPRAARQLVDEIGIGDADKCSFTATQTMFFPSCKKGFEDQAWSQRFEGEPFPSNVIFSEPALPERYEEISIGDAAPDATPEEIQWVIDRLKAAENTLDRDAWVQLCLAVKGVCGEAAREAFLAFSYRWPDTKQGDPEREWDTAKPNGSLTLGTIKHHLGSEGAPKSDDMDLSEDALALGLGKSGWDADAKFVSNWGKWLFWDGSRWVVDERKKAFTDIRTYLRHKAQSLMDWAEEKCANEPEPEKLMKAAAKQAKELRANGKVTAIEALARSNPKSAALAEDFDAALMLTGTPQGTVDLEQAELRGAKREDMLTKSTSVSPAPAGAKPHLWLEFLDTIFDGDQEVIGFMQRLCGYALTGRTDEQKLFFLHGSGANGKSVFLNTLVWLFGDYARRAPSDTFLMTRGEQHPTNLAGLHGARLVVGSELPKGKTWNDSVIKDLTGGDRIAARYMRQDFFEFDPQLTLMIAGNTKPSFGAVDNAMKRRVVLIPFDVTIPPEKRDGKLEQNLRSEGPEILRWCMEGAADWGVCGLAIPEVIRAASETYLEGEDELGQFLEDCTVADATGFVSNGDLWERYSGWCLTEDNNQMGKNNFLKAIEERGFKAKKGTGGTRGKSGLRLK